MRNIIEAEGPVTVARYMELALQHPEHGYYRKRDPLGAEGDFVTAPEVSQMFGELIGLWCADVWRQMGKPEAFTLLELGPGRGTLMQDGFACATAKITGFHLAMKLRLFESDAVLREAQTKKLGDYNPVYIDDFEQLPEAPLLVIANEFFDSLPVRQFVKTKEGWCERRVGLVDGHLAFVLSPPDPGIAMVSPFQKADVSDDLVFEMSPLAFRL